MVDISDGSKVGSLLPHDLHYICLIILDLHMTLE